jgi:hypothetical protein
MLPPRTAVLLCLALGVALELGTLGARMGLPLVAIAAVAIGYFSHGRGWLAPAVIGPARFAAALYRGGSMAAAWLGPFVYYLAALSVPMLLAAYLGRRLRTRFTARR